MFKRRARRQLDTLLDEVEQVKQDVQENTLSKKQLTFQSNDKRMQKLIDSMNELIAMLQTKHEALYEKHQIVTELTGVGTWDLEIKDGVPTERNNYNDILRQALGYESEQDFPNVFESWYNTVHPEEVDMVTNRYQDHLSGVSKTPYDMEYRGIKKDGSVEWFHVKAETLRDEFGVPYRNVGTFLNIHESKLNTMRIDNLLSRLDLIEKSLSYSVSTLEGAWGMELKGSRLEEQEVWFSPQFRRLLGCEADEFEPTVDSWLNLIERTDREEVRQRFEDFLYNNRSETDFNMRFKLQINTGEYRWFNMLATIVRDDIGNPTLVSGVLRDINHDIKRQEYDEKIENEMNDFTHSIKELANNINDISIEAVEIANEQETTAQSATQATESIALTQAVTELIRDISNQTNLLGLNAAIEAARAGEHGAGFSIVAEEVQKLSSDTAEAVGNIEEILNDVNLSVREIVSSITNMSEQIHSQATVTEQINSSTENINDMSGRLLTLIRQLNN